MATKLTKDLIRETTIEIDGVPLWVALGSDQTIGFKLKGSRGGYSKIHLSKVCAQTSGFQTPSEQDKQLPDSQEDVEAPEGSVTIQEIFDALETEKTMPWPYKSALRKFLRRRFK